MNVVCPRCRCVVVPPAPVFQCPCGQLMTYSVDGPGGLQSRHSLMSMRAHPSMHHGMSYGPSFYMAQQQGAQQQQQQQGGNGDASGAGGGIPHSLLQLFPVVKWDCATMGKAKRRGSMMSELGSVEEVEEVGGSAASLSRAVNNPDLLSCRVCLLDYEDEELVKTLPCMHRFHGECIDRWLGSNRTCPVCKTYVDARTSFEVDAPPAVAASRATTPSDGAAGIGAQNGVAPSSAPAVPVGAD